MLNELAAEGRIGTGGEETVSEKPVVFNYEDFLAALRDLREVDYDCTFCKHRKKSSECVCDCFNCPAEKCPCIGCDDNSHWEWRGRIPNETKGGE